VTYGKANHEITQDIINHAMPEYEVKWSDEGY
jgi:hypothetical protein